MATTSDVLKRVMPKNAAVAGEIYASVFKQIISQDEDANVDLQWLEWTGCWCLVYYIQDASGKLISIRQEFTCHENSDADLLGVADNLAKVVLDYLRAKQALHAAVDGAIDPE